MAKCCFIEDLIRRSAETNVSKEWKGKPILTIARKSFLKKRMYRLACIVGATGNVEGIIFPFSTVLQATYIYSKSFMVSLTGAKTFMIN